MNNLKITRVSKWLAALALALPIASRAKVAATAKQGVNFQPAVSLVKPSAVPAPPGAFVWGGTYVAPPPQMAPAGGMPMVQMMPPPPPNQTDPAQQAQMMALAQQFLSMMSGGEGRGGNPNGFHGDDPPAPNADGSIIYPDNHRFYSGGTGLKNIGSGMCTQANQNSSQVKNGYCQMLVEALNDAGTADRPESCAHRELTKILAEAGPDGSGVGDLQKYCSTYGQMSSEDKTNVFVQLLSGLIVQESGWDPGQKEPEWFRNGHAMGGKGTFQIGVSDRTKDRDCQGLNDSTILDARTNIRCGSCIALKYIAFDRTIGHGYNDDHTVGMARYFGPMRNAQAHKRAAIANSTNQFCVANVQGTDMGHLAAAPGATGRQVAAAAAR